MSGAVAKVSKPVIRGFLHNQIKRNLIVGCTLSVTAGLLMYFGVNEPTKRAYAEFYSTYDIEKDFQRMKKAGLFESCGPSD